MIMLVMMLVKFYPVRITRSGFPLYVITYIVILTEGGLMRQGIVEAGDWHVCGVYVSVSCWGWERISVQVDAQSFSVVSFGCR